MNTLPKQMDAVDTPLDREGRVIKSLGVVIATVGRREIAAQTILSLANRSSVPSIVVVVGAQEADLPLLPAGLPFLVKAMISPAKGSAIQRNQGLPHLPKEIEYVGFLDDDMEVHDSYCSEIEQVFRREPKVAGFSGWIAANGGIDRAAARGLLDGHKIPPDMPCFGFYPKKWPGFYGCSMNIRRCWLEVERFDERLPLYALGEDCEMGFRLSRHGSVGGSARCAVVHLAVRSGRISEVGVGYAQIANYLYFAGKGIGYPRWSTYWQTLVRLPLVNLFFRCFPGLDRKSGIDRKGRFQGNLLAWWDLVRGRLRPENLTKIGASRKG